MFIRAAILTAFALGAGQPVKAEPPEAQGFERGSATAKHPFAGERSMGALEMEDPTRPAYKPAPDPRAELMKEHSAAARDRDIVQFAIYASIGNRDGMEILSLRLRKFGVTREELQDFVDRTKLHGGLPPHSDRPAAGLE